MLGKNSEERLNQYNQEAYLRQVHKIGERIRCYVGYGHSNSIVIEGDTSLIVIDALDTDARALRLIEELKKITDKPVKTLIYTHGHPDHRGGSGAFKDTVEEIIAFAPKRQVLKHTDKINRMLMERTVKQFGYKLTDEEVITQGLGIREGSFLGDGKMNILPPTTIYTEDKVVRTIDGVVLEMVAAVGETDDQIFVWIPEEKVLCCGDNYYACWPNLYAIRGSQYRDVAAWVDSLRRMLTYPAKVLLPGHTNPIWGEEKIQEVLGTYADAVEWVLLKTLDCMNQGMSESETVEAVQLPKEYKEKFYLGEFYGTVEWSVRAIYGGYVGWFDGNATSLSKLADHVYAERLVHLIGEEKLMAEIKECLKGEEYQMAAQLCDELIRAGKQVEEAKQAKGESLLGLSRLISSANGRHYYIASAKELM